MTIPVFSVSHLREKLGEIKPMADAISSLVFINCGGSIPLHREWFYAEQYNLKAYIIDSHRPLHNLNVTDESQKIIVIDDGCKSFQECPSLDDYQMLEALNNMRGGDEDEDDLDEEGDDDEADSSDDEAGMEKKGLIDDEEEAEEAQNMMGAATAGGVGQEGAEIIGDRGADTMGMSEVRAAMREDKEKEEAKQELADLRGSDDEDDGEAGYKEGAA